jgi:ribonuclease E
MTKTKKVMLISADHPEEVRAVIIENGKLEEFIVEHSGQELLKGNVYLGVITRVEPGIEAAFVDIGWKKFGFLPFKDVLKENYVQTGEKKAKIRIQDVLIRGQKILVQVVKESRDHKGPSLTNAVTIPGRFLVLMNGSDSSGVSRKIEDEAERKKLKVILKDLNIPENMGIIVRTAGLGRTKIELQKDIQMLMKIWNDILNGKKNSDQAPCLLYKGPDMVVRTVRDHFTTDTAEIMVDKKESYKALKDFIKLMMPRMIRRVKHYQDPRPLFAKYNIEEQIQNIYRRTVDLPSGGSIVFDSGEAMVSIDVNSGKATGESDLEETALRTNLEAADAIGRELRLRDLGGLVVIDFIDMFQKKNKSLVEKQLKLSVKSDKARINMARLSRFGLMELSRQRIAPPVKDAVFNKCTICAGSGHVKSDNAASLDVIRKIQNIISDDAVKRIAVTISNSVAQYILNNKKEFLVDIENKQKVKIDFYGKENISQENFIYSVVEKVTEEEKKIFKISEIAEKPDIEVATDADSPKDEVKSDRPRGRGRRPSSGDGQRKRTSKSSTRNNSGRGRRRTPNRSRTPKIQENTSIAPNQENTSDDNIGNKLETSESENKPSNQPTISPTVTEKDSVVSNTKISDQNLEVSGNIKQVEVAMDTPEP